MQHYQSNRLERLFEQLLTNCLRNPLTDPFAAETIIVQHPGMGQWISRAWALATGIASLLAFPLPARALGELQRLLSGTTWQDELWQSPVLRWRIFALLPGYSADPAFAPLAAYLQDRSHAGTVFQLAGRIAAVFDQYLVYRPDLLAQWENTPNPGDWQAILWRRLCEDSPAHRAHLHGEFRSLLGHKPGLTGQLSGPALPQRLHLFGISSLAPVYLDLFVRLSRHIDTCFYQLSPCSQYWHDLAPARHQAKAQAQDALLAFSSQALFSGHADNSLLAQLGQAGRDFARQLLESGLDAPQELYEEPKGTSLLAELQRQLLNCSPIPAQEERSIIAPEDDSLELHLCYSPLREVQVLHDYLLDCFQKNPALNPGDILVTAPDISRYAPAVQAVFGEAPRGHAIPWSLADQPQAENDSLARLFLSLLDTLNSRCTSTALLSLLEHPALHRRFGLDAAQLPLAHQLVQIAGIRWGLNAQHRHELGIDSGSAHSWRHGLDRLLLGYAMGSIDALHTGLLPCAPGGEEANQVLAALLAFFDRVEQWRLRWQEAGPASSWPPLLLQILADFFHPDYEEEGLGQLRQSLQNLQEELELAGCAHWQGLLSPEVIRLRLEESLGAAENGQAFLSGRVTFCNMVPMRSLPFAVICMLGMNDGDFPRLQHPVSFDQMAQHPRLGDRNRRDDDRYLFLEAIFSARTQLFISWIGRSQRDGSERPPSVVVSELCDYLDSTMQVGDDPRQKISAHVQREHPLQPFSAANYTGLGKPASFNLHWLPAAEATISQPFQDAPLPVAQPADREAGEEPQEKTEVELATLLRFWKNPARYFLCQNLGMRLREDEAAVEEDEPFSLDGLECYSIRREITERRLRHQEKSHIGTLLSAQGLLPQGNFASLALTDRLDEAEALAEALGPHLVHPLSPVEVALHLEAGGIRICGWLDSLYSGGRIVWTSSRAKAKLMLETWICHLVLAAINPAQCRVCSQIIAWDSKTGLQHIGFDAMEQTEAKELLSPYVEGFFTGQQAALPFFPESALAWAEQINKGKDMDNACFAARKAWQGWYKQTGEGEDAAFQLLFPQEDPCNEHFLQLARLFLPMLAARVEGTR